MCNEESNEVARNKNKWDTDDENYVHEILWNLEIDGSVNKLGAGVGVWIYNLDKNHSEGHAYRLNFRCTNNMAEYEALILGLKLVRNLGAQRVSVIGDSELVVNQIKGVYMTEDTRLGYYRGTIV